MKQGNVGLMGGILAVLTPALAAVPLMAGDWANWRGPRHNGISDEQGWQTSWPAAGPKIAWRASVGTGFSSIAVSQGRVYTMGNVRDRDVVSCLDLESGSEIWKKQYASPLVPNLYEGGPNATPTVDGDAVYTFSKSGIVYCWGAAGGRIVWTKNLPDELGVKVPTWGFSGSILVWGERLIINAGGTGVALEKTTGKLVWHEGSEVAGYAAPVPFKNGGKDHLAVFGGKAIMGVDPANGKELWRFGWATRADINAADPIIADRQVFVSSAYGVGCGLIDFGGANTKAVWKNKDMRNKFSSCVLWKGHLYGVDAASNDRATVTCMELASGDVIWAQQGFRVGSLMMADGKLIILDGRGDLVIATVSPQGYQETARASVLQGKCWTAPVLAWGRVLARNADGDLVCVDLRAQDS